MTKILHVGHQIPDVRVEKMMLAAKDFGFKVEIATERIKNFTFEPLKGTPVHFYKASVKDHFGWANNAKERLKEIVEEVDPDIIHAHDIYNAHFVADIDRPLVYDDHEYWSNAIKNDTAPGSWLSFGKWKRSVGLQIRRRNIPKWEQEILSRSTVITVAERIAEAHRKFNPHVFVVENFPHSTEIYDVPLEGRDPVLSAYIGRDLGTMGNKYRSTGNFFQLARSTKDIKLKIIGDVKIKSEENIISTGFVDHRRILGLIADCTFGLGPWIPHESHQYSSANKLYLYAHAGLHIIIPYTLTIHPFSSYSYFKTHEEIFDIIRNPPKIEPEEIIHHARENILFDLRYPRIKEAYDIALNP